jgi:hypothetical protein
MTRYEERAARGAAFMDAHYPGWEKDVNLKTLNIGSNEFCILGQRYQDYDVGTVRLGIGDDMDAQYALGFMATPGEGRGQYPQLTKAWRREIMRRLRRSTTVARATAKPQRSTMRRAQPVHA